MIKQEMQLHSVFGQWKILSLNKHGRKILCLCTICNKEQYIDYYRLRSSKARPPVCECKLQNSKKGKIKVGDTYGYWKILSIPKKRLIKCICTACNQTVKDLDYLNLLKQKSKSCGCMKSYLTSKTWQKRYGGHPRQDLSILEKAEKTNLKRYGARNPFASKEIQARIRESNLQNLGVPYPTQNSKIREKIKQSNKEKYGVEYISQSPDIQVKIRKTLIKTGFIKRLNSGELVQDICAKYAIPESHTYKVLREYGEESFWNYVKNYERQVYSTELNFILLLQDKFPSLNTHNKKPLEFDSRKRPDFRLEKGNRILYVNIDGLYYHSEYFRNKQYHLDLAKDFKVNDQVIFQFRSDELRDRPLIIRSMILNYFGLHDIKYNARQLNIRKVSSKESRLFFDNNHLMGSYKSSQAYGLYTKEGQLVSCLSIRYRKKNNCLEIARFANLLNTSVRGGFSKLLKYVEREYSPSKIISFCDLRYSTGKSYEKCGFRELSITLGWQWTDGNVTYNRLRCRANMDQRKLSQAEYAKELGWYKIYDAGQIKYIKQVTQHKRIDND